MDAEHLGKSQGDQKGNSSFARTMEIIGHARPVTGSPHQLYAGALIATCIAFLVSLLGISHLDIALTISVMALAVAMPLLVVDFIVASFGFTPGPATRVPILLQAATYVITEPLGGLAVVVAVAAAIAHLSPPAAVVFIVAGPITFVLGSLAAVAGLLVWAWRKVRAESNAAALPPGDAATPV